MCIATSLLCARKETSALFSVEWEKRNEIKPTVEHVEHSS
jgi:hypothetical protein